jgi:branched-chain amino acid transport system ATP-binding protein
MAETVLAVHGLWAAYGATPILQGVEMTINRGEIVGVIGRNGAGKTTLMRCLIGLIRATRGSIAFQGKDITALTADARAREGIGYIPQGRDVFPQMTVEENLEVGKLIGGPDARKLSDLVYSYFPRLKERRRQIAGTMSGGEQQQLAIARALMSHPQLLIFDEPSLGLSPKLVDQVFALVQKLHKEGMTILLVEQNVAQALNIADRAYLIRMGRVEAAGTPQELRQTVDVESAYLGAATAQAASGREL